MSFLDDLLEAGDIPSIWAAPCTAASYLQTAGVPLAPGYPSQYHIFVIIIAIIYHALVYHDFPHQNETLDAYIHLLLR
jgi:hypothetical protein